MKYNALYSKVDSSICYAATAMKEDGKRLFRKFDSRVVY